MKMNCHKTVTTRLMLCVLFISGCKSYVQKPLNWNEISSQWHDTTTVCEINHLNDAVQIALALNPEINKLRTVRLTSQRYAAEAGWWDDPSLGFEALRILDGGAHPLITGLGLNFTLPLTGVPELRKRVAEFYSDADIWMVATAERELMMRVVKSWAKLDYSVQRIKLLEEFQADFQGRVNLINALIKSGELPRSEGEHLLLIKARYSEMLEKQRGELHILKSEFLQTLGLHPLSKLNLVADVREIEAWQQVDLKFMENDLLENPAVREQLARFNASEQELRLEIRRQYPELELGPRYANEEGLDRFGFDAGLSLPLWNRNRQKIARAEGERALQYEAVIALWKKLVADYYRMRVDLANSERKMELISTERYPLTKKRALRTEFLFSQGECDLTELWNAQEELLEVGRELIDVRERHTLSLIEIHFLTKGEGEL